MAKELGFIHAHAFLLSWSLLLATSTAVEGARLMIQEIFARFARANTRPPSGHVAFHRPRSTTGPLLLAGGVYLGRTSTEVCAAGITPQEERLLRMLCIFSLQVRTTMRARSREARANTKVVLGSASDVLSWQPTRLSSLQWGHAPWRIWRYP